MSWTRRTRGIARFGTSCLAFLLLWSVVIPALAFLLAFADVGEPAWILGFTVLAVLAVVLYVIASWD